MFHLAIEIVAGSVGLGKRDGGHVHSGAFCVYHLQPRFVEDSVRISLQSTLERYPELKDEDFVLARQLNFETIHSHDVLAERYGTVGELRGELRDREPATRHTELREWLSS